MSQFHKRRRRCDVSTHLEAELDELRLLVVDGLQQEQRAGTAVRVAADLT